MLYIVPTPIGNLKDMSFRAISILHTVNLIAAEDTRHTGILLKHFSINTNLISFYDFNERKQTDILITKMKSGLSIALVSDYGTPLISDPGYYLVRRCREMGISIIPLPGPCAAITALSASGLPANRFCFEGFLPSKRKARQERLQDLSRENRTLIVYESKHRLLDSLKDMSSIFSPDRYVVLAKELTKIWETIIGLSLEELIAWTEKKMMHKCGEIVLIIDGFHEPKEHQLSSATVNTLHLLMQELSLTKAVQLTAHIHGIQKNKLYKFALQQNIKS